MPVDLVTLTETLDADETSAWLEVSPQRTFVDGDGETHPAGKITRGRYVNRVLKADDGAAIPNPFTLVASDSEGNTPETVLYKIRRVLGSGTQTWTDVLLPAAVPSVPLVNLEEVPGSDLVTVRTVTSVNGTPPDATGNVVVSVESPVDVVT